MGDMASGISGQHVTRPAEMEIGLGQGNATAQNQLMEASLATNKALVVKLSMKTATLNSAQWMEDSANGPTGLPAPSPVELEAGKGKGSVTTQPHNMEANNVSETSRRMKTATQILVQELVIGATGHSGLPAL